VKGRAGGHVTTATTPARFGAPRHGRQLPIPYATDPKVIGDPGPHPGATTRPYHVTHIRKGPHVTQAWINRIGTAVPPYDIHDAFVEFGRDTIADPHKRALFDRMASLADIEHRYAIIEAAPRPRETVLDMTGFYRRGAFPSTAARMALYEPHALELAMRAVRALEPDGVTHLVVASCTGFTAPGLDFQVMREAGLPDSTQRTIVGFMGCFAAVNALKLANDMVRADASARVLVVNLELCSLHLQEDFQDVAKMLSFLLFADGASAALVTADPLGIALGRFRATVIPRSAELITWHIGDQGFEMHLSGQVPGRIRRWLPEQGRALVPPEPPDLFAVHAGGRSILDAVQQGLLLRPDALRYSRQVLRDHGNMSSATLMFVLAAILADPDARGPGMGMAFGPGLSVETFAFARA
jgi:predicted naringenin-chalcone synthase